MENKLEDLYHYEGECPPDGWYESQLNLYREQFKKDEAEMILAGSHSLPVTDNMTTGRLVYESINSLIDDQVFRFRSWHELRLSGPMFKSLRDYFEQNISPDNVSLLGFKGFVIRRHDKLWTVSESTISDNNFEHEFVKKLNVYFSNNLKTKSL